MSTETATIHIHICDQRRGYNATFSTEAQALEFLARRGSSHAFWELNTENDGPGSVPATWTQLLDYLYPTCEHGLSLDLCHGPDHYMSASQERAMDFQYADAPAGF
jgi:hypothetical protein